MSSSPSLDELIFRLRTFNNRKLIVKALRKELRKTVPPIRLAIRRKALAQLPKRGGLNRWVAKLSITSTLRVSGQGAGITLRGGRNSKFSRSHMRGLDGGRLRHPSWGRRGRGQWHNQAVIPRFFTGPSSDVDQWHSAVTDAVNEALRVVRLG